MTEFARPEDGHWDTQNPNVFYWATTGHGGQTARSFDNLTVDGDGNVIVQEDPGGSAYIAKTWKIDPVSKTAVQIFESDRARFLPGAPDFLTHDEENSGVIEVTNIVRNANWYEPGRRYYLGNMQAHYSIPGELAQGGQIYLMASPNMPAAPASTSERMAPRLHAFDLAERHAAADVQIHFAIETERTVHDGSRLDRHPRPV